MEPGLLGIGRASATIDVVVVALVLFLPLFAFSIYLVKVHRAYEWHQRMQVGLFVILLIAIVMFELDVRLNGWTGRALASPYYDNILFPFLYVHIVMAVMALVSWGATLWEAHNRFDRPAQPGPHSRRHKAMARFAGVTMVLTILTGWGFYYMAFVATG